MHARSLYADMVCFFQLEGSMIIAADNIMGSTRVDENGEPTLQYGHRFDIACFSENLQRGYQTTSQVQK